MRVFTVFLAIAGLLLAQNPAFEVATIRVAKDDGDHDSSTDRLTYRIHNFNLRRLIATAYGVDTRGVVGGPPWTDSETWDIVARIPEEYAQKRDRDTVPKMLQNLLAERFHLVTSRARREISGYALVIGKNGPRLETADPNDKTSGMNTKGIVLSAHNSTMESLARHLSRNGDVGKLVVDRTGLPGGFNFQLKWLPQSLEGKPEAPQDVPSIFTAMQEQLGLRLEPAKVPVEAVVIESGEKPSDN